MDIADSILREKLKNVYFIWGRGKSTIAGELRRQYGCFVYSTDEGKERNWRYAVPENQPYMCRDFEREYGVNSFWEIPAEVIREREIHVQREVTPMIVADLLALAPQYPVILCEGDIDYSAVIPFASHTVYLDNRSTKFDWFDRPDHDNIAEITNRRTDITEEEKQAIIRKAYAAVGQSVVPVPDWVTENHIHPISWDENTGIPETAAEVARYFRLDNDD